MTNLINVFFHSKIKNKYFIVFIVFSSFFSLIFSFFPSNSLGWTGEMVLSGFLSGCFIELGVEFKSFVKSVVFISVICFFLTYLIFLFVRYFEGPQEHLFQIKYLFESFKVSVGFVSLILIPPVIGYGAIYLAGEGCKLILRKVKK